MRLFTIAAGILGFVGIAYGGDALQFRTAPRHYEAQYVYAPGTSEQASIQVALDRQYKFSYVGAQVDPANPKGMASDPDSLIREYLFSDVQEAITNASKEAAASKRKLGDVLPGYLAGLRRKDVDCRIVARRMVENLFGNRVELKDLSDGRVSHRYQERGDSLDTFVIARNLENVTISRDPSLKAGDNYPRFSCYATKVDGATAKCGDLRLQYNPLKATGGAFAGQNALVFNPNDCAKYMDDMDFNSCELMYQVQRCGLRSTQKADGDRIGNPNTRGLADFLDEVKSGEVLARQNGTYNRSGESNVPATAAAETSESSVPSTFYNDFKSGGAGKPAL